MSIRSKANQGKWKGILNKQRFTKERQLFGSVKGLRRPLRAVYLESLKALKGFIRHFRALCHSKSLIRSLKGLIRPLRPL